MSGDAWVATSPLGVDAAAGHQRPEAPRYLKNGGTLEDPLEMANHASAHDAALRSPARGAQPRIGGAGCSGRRVSILESYAHCAHMHSSRCTISVCVARAIYVTRDIPVYRATLVMAAIIASLAVAAESCGKAALDRNHRPPPRARL
jgi:hypothetical protein